MPNYGPQLRAIQERKKMMSIFPDAQADASTPTGPGETGAAAPGNLAGAPAFGYSGAYGGVPQVPNPLTTAGTVTAGNLGNLPSILDLAGQVDTFSNKQAVAPYVANLPGYTANLGQAATNTGSLLEGEVPADVLNLLQQQGAERGAAIGSSGSPNAMAGYLKALGLTSLGLKQQGLSNFGTLMGLTPVGKQFDPASMFVTPEQQQAAQAAANLYNSAPIPAQKAAADLNAALAGVRAGRGSSAGGLVAPSAPSSSPRLTLPSYATQPTAPSSPSPTTGLPPESTGYDPATWDQWMNEFDLGTNVNQQPASTGYGNADSFVNQYAGQPSEEDIYNWLGIPSE